VAVVVSSQQDLYVVCTIEKNSYFTYSVRKMKKCCD